MAASTPHSLNSDAPEPGDEYNPFDEVEFLPGLGYAVLAVVLAYLFVYVLLLPGNSA